jgi:hypothetical protein
MPISSNSRIQLAYIKEATFGVTPATGTSRKLRMTGESLSYSLTKESSKEINSTRSISNMIITSGETSGNIQAEMQFTEYDPFIEAALQSTFTQYGTKGVGAVFSATIAATTITAGTAPTGSSAFTLLQPGQWFTLQGTNSANDNKLFRVSKVTAPTSTVITLDPGTPGVAGGPYANTVLTASRLTNGVLQPSFTLERQLTDAGEFFTYRGMTVSTMNLKISSGAISTLEFGFMGKDAVRDNTTDLPGTLSESQTYPVMSGVAGTACSLWSNGAPLTGTYVNSVSLSYDNTLRQQRAICSPYAVGIGAGAIKATADLEVYFASGATFYNEFLNNSNIEIAFTSFDSNGNGYIFTIPAANVSDYSVNASGGSDSDVMATIKLTALRDAANANAALRQVMFVDRVGAAML